MVNKFALLDSEMKVIGIINLPENLSFSTPHHVPNARIENGETVKLGMFYDQGTSEFVYPDGIVKRIIKKIIPTPAEISRSIADPPLPEGKSHLFSFYRKRK